MNISDMLIQTFAAESLMLRVKKLEQIKGEEQVKIYKDIMDAFFYEAAARIRKSATDAICAFAVCDEFCKLKNALETLTAVKPLNIKDARRRVAAKLIDENLYGF